jgi:cupin 2 domain-containing protein
MKDQDRDQSVGGTGNLFAEIPDVSTAEIFTRLAEGGRFTLERIVSTGQATPPGEWYDQDTDEWVVLLSGSAGLLIEGETRPRILKPGDFALLPAHQRHRVEWTADGEPTVWLALHFVPEDQGETAS